CLVRVLALFQFHPCQLRLPRPAVLRGRDPISTPYTPYWRSGIDRWYLALAATPMIGVKTYLVTDYGKPFTPAGFGNWFRERCNEAGLLHCSAHGLRKAFLRRMAEAGCSEDYIASISGHRDTREIRTYVQAANKARMATDGMARTLAMFPVREAGQ